MPQKILIVLFVFVGSCAFAQKEAIPAFRVERFFLGADKSSFASAELQKEDIIFYKGKTTFNYLFEGLDSITYKLAGLTISNIFLEFNGQGKLISMVFSFPYTYYKYGAEYKPRADQATTVLYQHLEKNWGRGKKKIFFKNSLDRGYEWQHNDNSMRLRYNESTSGSNPYVFIEVDVRQKW